MESKLLINMIGNVRFSTQGKKVKNGGYIKDLVVKGFLNACEVQNMLEFGGYIRVNRVNSYLCVKDVSGIMVELPEMKGIIKNGYSLLIKNKNFFTVLLRVFFRLEGRYYAIFYYYCKRKSGYIPILKALLEIENINTFKIIELINGLAEEADDKKLDLSIKLIAIFVKDEGDIEVKEIKDIREISNKNENTNDNRIDKINKMDKIKLNKVSRNSILTRGLLRLFPMKRYYTSSSIINKSDGEKFNSIILEKDLEIIENLRNEVYLLEEEIKVLRIKGFVIYRQIVNEPKKFPILTRKMLSYLGEPKGYKKVNEYNKFKFLRDEALGYLITWVYNILLLEKYLKYKELTERLKGYGVGMDNDIYVDLISDMREIFSKLDPSIRVKFQKRGITVLHNIHTGFDTEYDKIDMDYNKLLSVQLAVSYSSIIEIPLVQDYTIVKIDPLTSGKSEINIDLNVVEKEVILKGKMENDINVYINIVGQDKGYIETMKLLSNLLREQGLKSIIDDNKGKEIFLTDNSPINVWIRKTDKMSLNEVTRISYNLSKVGLDMEYEGILDKLRTRLKEIEDKEEEEDNKRLLEYDGVKQVECKKVEFSAESDDMDVVKREDIKELQIIEEEEDKIGKNSRTWSNTISLSDKGISISRRWKTYIIGHFLHADLSMLNDFHEFKDSLKIINKSLVSGKLEVNGMKVVLRDTVLLSPAGSSLEKIGKLHGGKFLKVEVEKYWKENMGRFLIEKPEEFEKYAIQDAVVALIHGLKMEKYINKLGRIGIPVTISVIAGYYIRDVWNKIGYKGYHLKGDGLGDISQTYTPKGLRKSDEIALNIGMYIKNCRGGRNESFMYGIDLNTEWYDYDLTSAYTTAMCLLGDPDYKRGRIIFRKEILKMSDEELIKSYIIISVSFVFPNNTKYPSIPVRLDDNITVYPLIGESVLTGAEYVLAKNQKCKILIKESYYIPFKEKSIEPFKCIMKEIQSERIKYPKKTFMNELMKLIGNTGYGIVCKGFSDKTRFDIATQSQIKLKGNDLTNPILAGWITGFIRSIISELMHNVSLLDGRVVSVTTDGFITNIENLEDRILKSRNCNINNNRILLKIYRATRNDLSDNPVSLELKGGGIKELISWATRGQFSKDGKISAATGLQKKAFSGLNLGDLLHSVIEDENKNIGYNQSRLRSALEVYKTEKHVTMLYTDRNFSLYSDNKRKLLPIKWNEGFYDSIPLKRKEECSLNRTLAKIGGNIIYNKTSQINLPSKKYGSYIEMAVRKFIRCMFAEQFNLSSKVFKNYNEMVSFIKNSTEGKVKMNANIISLLKRKSVIHGGLIENDDVKSFLFEIERSNKFPGFSKEDFVKNSMINPSPKVLVVKPKELEKPKE